MNEHGDTTPSTLNSVQQEKLFTWVCVIGDCYAKGLVDALNADKAAHYPTARSYYELEYSDTGLPADALAYVESKDWSAALNGMNRWTGDSTLLRYNSQNMLCCCHMHCVRTHTPYGCHMLLQSDCHHRHWQQRGGESQHC